MIDPLATVATTTLFFPSLRAPKGFETGFLSGGRKYDYSQHLNERGLGVVFDAFELCFPNVGYHQRGKGEGTSGKTPNKSVNT